MLYRPSATTSPKYGMTSVIGGTACTLTITALTVRCSGNVKRLNA